jgi:hypothetical protein
MARGLARTAPLGPDILRACRWIHAAARLLGNADGARAAVVRCRFDGLIGARPRPAAKAGALAPAVDHVHKVARSYRPGLFHCTEVADLPRTNNDLEPLFGSARDHERRATGGKTAAPAAVARADPYGWSPAWSHGSARPQQVIWRASIGSAGVMCAKRSTSVATAGPCRRASGATPTPISPRSNRKQAS